MTAKKLELELTPQNEEWIKLIPNPTKNLNIVLNRLIDVCMNDGMLLEVISQSLTVSDLSKFKTGYSRMQRKRAEHMADLDVSLPHIERKRLDDEEPSMEVSSKEDLTTKKEKKISHGFTEEQF